MHENVVVPIGVFSMFGWIAWVVFSSIRRYLVAKSQANVQITLLERIDSSQSLIAYAETEAGGRFLDALAMEANEPTAPYKRILNGVQTGIILSSFGAALLLLHSTGVETESDFTIFGTIALALGLGFCIAAAAAYILSRSFGLLQRSPRT